jgi:ribonuclease R
MSRKKRKKTSYLFEHVLNVLKKDTNKSLNYKQVSAELEITEETDRLQVLEILENLVLKKQIIETSRGKYQAKSTQQYITGTVDMTSSGSAYIQTDEEGDDIYIPSKFTKNALHKDLVKVYLFPSTKGKKREGEIIEVLQRNKTEFIGAIQISPQFAFVICDNNKVHVDFFIPGNKINGAKNGQKVIIQLLDWEKGEKNPSAEVTRILGMPGMHKTEMHAIMAEYGLPEGFPEIVEKEAQDIKDKITKKEIDARRDFRKITTFTIDPVDAKDFDDALSIEQLKNGHWEVGVHIADVTHYVRAGSQLENEAINRATSVYLVDRVIPMLPEKLSNEVCSLRPKEEKLCFSAVFELDEESNIYNEWYGKTVIYSDRRFSYEEVQEILEGAEGDYKAELHLLDSMAKKLRAKRSANGSVFFDRAEVKFKLDEFGNPLGVFFKTQKDANKLIEDFMLLANRKVAELVGGKPKSENKTAEVSTKNKKKDKAGENLCVYRIHDTPGEDKLNELTSFVGKFGYKMNMQNRSSVTSSINKLLKDVHGKKEANMIELLTIRSMPKAIYTTENIGHYGLGFDFYTHFTSPIRRYPDMMVHRLLEAHLAKENKYTKNDLEKKCKHSSEQEKIAAEAERASVKFKQVEYMSEFIGEKFDGVISGVTEWGIYVEINDNKCEGMIRMSNRLDDRYEFDETNYRYVAKRSGKVYTLGDTVRIVVKRADLTRKQLDYDFA